MSTTEAPDLDCMRASGRILSETLHFLSGGFVKDGITAMEISRKAEEIIRSFDGAVPSFLGYHGYPAAACVSVNEQVVHAIPSEHTIIMDGDIVSVDIGVYYQGHHTDACRTIGVGSVPQRTKKLLKVTSEALDRGISAARAGGFLGDISFEIQKHVERHGFVVSVDLVGHGIGRELHLPPCVPNIGPPRKGPQLEVGACLAIEPVVFDGPWDTLVQSDGWTVVSQHNLLSAHFEDTIIITEAGPEIITR